MDTLLYSLEEILFYTKNHRDYQWELASKDPGLSVCFFAPDGCGSAFGMFPEEARVYHYDPISGQYYRIADNFIAWLASWHGGTLAI